MSFRNVTHGNQKQLAKLPVAGTTIGTRNRNCPECSYLTRKYYSRCEPPSLLLRYHEIWTLLRGVDRPFIQRIKRYQIQCLVEQLPAASSEYVGAGRANTLHRSRPRFNPAFWHSGSITTREGLSFLRVALIDRCYFVRRALSKLLHLRAGLKNVSRISSSFAYHPYHSQSACLHP